MIAIAGLLFTIGGGILYYTFNINPFDENLFSDGNFDFNQLIENISSSIKHTQQSINAFIWVFIVGGIALTFGSIMRSNQLWRLQSSSQTDVHQLSVRIQKLEEQIKKLNNEKS